MLSIALGQLFALMFYKQSKGFGFKSKIKINLFAGLFLS